MSGVIFLECPEGKDPWDLSADEMERAVKASDKLKRKIIKSKKYDDAQFDEYFEMAINKMFYEADCYSSCHSFDDFEIELNQLFMYYQYNKRYLAHYIKTAKKHYNEQIENAKSAEEADIAFDSLYDSKCLMNKLYESVFLMLFATFEKLLKGIVQDACTAGNQAFIPKVKDEPTTYEYMNHLRWKLNIIVPHELYNDFDMIRLLRNSLVHSQTYTTLDRYIERDLHELWKSSNDRYNFRVIEFTFETLGKLAKCIEEAYNQKRC